MTTCTREAEGGSGSITSAVISNMYTMYEVATPWRARGLVAQTPSASRTTVFMAPPRDVVAEVSHIGFGLAVLAGVAQVGCGGYLP